MENLNAFGVWGVPMAVVCGAGIAGRSSRIRLAGMALLAAPLAKLFGYGVFLPEREYRVSAFVTLGVLMLSAGLLYQRCSQSIGGFLFGQRI